MNKKGFLKDWFQGQANETSQMAYTHPLSNLVHVVCQNVPHGLHVFRGKPFSSVYPLGPGNINGGKPSIILTSWQERHKSVNIYIYGSSKFQNPYFNTMFSTVLVSKFSKTQYMCLDLPF